MILGIDFLADGAGVLYATARGDAESVVVYSSALFVPFVGAGVIHTGQKFFNYCAKESSQNIVDITVKQWDEAHDVWIKVSNDIPYDETNKASVKNALEADVKSSDVDLPISVFVNLLMSLKVNILSGSFISGFDRPVGLKLTIIRLALGYKE